MTHGTPNYEADNHKTMGCLVNFCYVGLITLHIKAAWPSKIRRQKAILTRKLQTLDRVDRHFIAVSQAKPFRRNKSFTDYMNTNTLKYAALPSLNFDCELYIGQ